MIGVKLVLFQVNEFPATFGSDAYHRHLLSHEAPKTAFSFQLINLTNLTNLKPQTVNMVSPEKPSSSRSTDSTSKSLMDIMESLPTRKRQLARDDEADVVLQFETSYIIVNARIMSEASPVFKDLLASNSHGQAPRSATNPQWIEMSDDVCPVHMKFLCASLHDYELSSDYPGTNEHAVLSLLNGMATVAKRFQAVDYLSKTISPLLLQPFAKHIGGHIRDQDQEQGNLDRDAHLAKIAYLLEQEAMFSVFTRRMILDHCIPLSQL